MKKPKSESYVITRTDDNGAVRFLTQTGGWGTNPALAFTARSEEGARARLHGRPGEVVSLEKLNGSTNAVVVEEPVGKAAARLNAAESETMWECERAIEQGLETFMDVGNALAKIRDGRLYREGYRTFEEYCQKKWEITARRGRQLIDACDTVKLLGEPERPSGNTDEAARCLTPGGVHQSARCPAVLPKTESQVRPLAALPKEKRAEAWTEAVAESRKNGKETPTAKVVQEVVDKLNGKSNGKQWPKPNAFGTYDEKLADQLSDAAGMAKILTLQIKEGFYISSHSYNVGLAGASCPLSKDRGTWPDKDQAVSAAARAMKASLAARNDCRSKSDKAKIEKLVTWLNGVIGRRDGETPPPSEPGRSRYEDPRVPTLRRVLDDLDELERETDETRDIVSITAAKNSLQGLFRRWDAAIATRVT